MTALALARLQFAITTVYHFFFVPLTLGLSILVTIMETLYVRSGDAVYGLVGAVSVGMVGHSQAQHMFETQPMKMASAEACCCGPFPCPNGQRSRLDIGRRQGVAACSEGITGLALVEEDSGLVLSDDELCP